MSGRVPQLLENGDARAEYGCVVSFENADGATFSVHRQGPPLRGLKEACAIALARDEGYRVVCFSTPQTIFTDLQERDYAGPQRLPEHIALGRIGLAALLHPRLRSPGRPSGLAR